jgi:hypothetical protein
MSLDLNRSACQVCWRTLERIATRPFLLDNEQYILIAAITYITKNILERQVSTQWK